MLDINLIRKNPEHVTRALQKRMDDIDFTDLLIWDEKRRAHIAEAGQLRAKRNSVSAQIPQIKKAGGDIAQIQTEMRDVSTRIKTIETELAAIEQNIHHIYRKPPQHTRRRRTPRRQRKQPRRTHMGRKTRTRL